MICGLKEHKHWLKVAYESIVKVIKVKVFLSSWAKVFLSLWNNDSTNHYEFYLIICVHIDLYLYRVYIFFLPSCISDLLSGKIFIFPNIDISRFPLQIGICGWVFVTKVNTVINFGFFRLTFHVKIFREITTSQKKKERNIF